jgi:hypothetical protein
MNNEITLPEGWNSLEQTPPDQMVKVIDVNGNTSFAQPTWYPFKVVPNPKRSGKWSSDVVSCEPYWDGGWMIQCVGLTSEIEEVIGWKLI